MGNYVFLLLLEIKYGFCVSMVCSGAPLSVGLEGEDCGDAGHDDV